MRLTPPPLKIGPNEGFTDDKDIFGHKAFGERLANVVAGIDQPLTLLLDGPWGCGKSTFVRQWAGLLRQRGMEVIEFDAFANDHHEDAFIVLAGEIIARLGDAENRTTNLLQMAAKAGAALLPVAARIAVRAASLGFLDAKDLGETVEAVGREIGDDAAKAAERAVSERLRQAGEERQALDSFRQALMEMAAGLNKKPLVFIIDELDRCRPPFALDLLERIKHLFAVPGVAFVLVSNLDQLAAAVKGAYGPDTDGRVYLEKFYDLRATLPLAREKRLLAGRVYVDHLWKAMKIGCGTNQTDESVRQQFKNLADVHNLSLRTIERVATHIVLAYRACGTKGPNVATPIVGLAVMRQVDHDLYKKAKTGKLSWEDAAIFMKFNEWENNEYVYQQQLWKFASEVNYKPHPHYDFEALLAVFSIRFDIVPWYARLLDDFHVPGE